MNEFFAKRLRLLRTKRGETQEAMGKLLGVTAVSYGAWERNTAEPCINDIIKLCQFFYVSADWLLGNITPTERREQQRQNNQIAVLKSCAEQASFSIAQLQNQIKSIEAICGNMGGISGAKEKGENGTSAER